MINIKPQIVSTLKTIPGIKQVCYSWPEDFEKIPCITYKIEDNSTNTITDNEEQLSNIRFEIDIWTEGASENSSIAAQVDNLFSGMGFQRGFYNDFKDDRLIHGVMKYYGIVDKNKKYVYQ